MAITVYASTASINNQYNNLVDAEIPQVDLTTTQALFAVAVDDSDTNASFSYNWSFVDKPSGSNASFSDSSIQEPRLNNIDVWGNYRIMVIATNSTTGEKSATDQIVAPNSSFVTVRVNSTNRGLEKPAKGERDWHTKAHEWVSAIDDTELNDLTGVSLGTLSNGEFLKYNGNKWVNAVPSGGNIEVTVGGTTQTLDSGAGDLVFKSTDSNVAFAVATNGNNVEVDAQLATDVAIDGNLTLNEDNVAEDAIINFRRGGSEIPQIMYDQSASTFKLKRDNAGGLEVIMTQDDVPTNSVRGGVLKVGSTFNSQGKILEIERLIYTQSADQSIEGKLTATGNEHPDIRSVNASASATSQGNYCHIMFKNTTGAIIAIANIQLTMLHAGTSSSTDYSFALNTYTNVANMVGNTTSQAVTLPTFSRPSGSSATGVCEWNHTTNNSGNFIEVGAGQYFGIEVLTHPDSHNGHGLRCTIEAFRNIEP
tara:strand:- start:531 stop:1970 length:1440 start_codon:yes stop_codon:yes gene_type:complete